jgi:hypothetical protein
MPKTVYVSVCAMSLLLLACSKDAPNDSAANMHAVQAQAGTGAAGNITISIPSGVTGFAGVATAGALSLDALQLKCDAAAESVTSCGASACPALSSAAASTCTVNCCTSDGHCGTRISDPRYAALGCIAPLATASTDPRCPTSTMFGLTLAGCCDAQGHCGQVVGPTCLAISAGPACDAADGGM